MTSHRLHWMLLPFLCALSVPGFAVQPMDEEDLESVHILGGDVLNVMGATAAGDVQMDNQPTTGETNSLQNVTLVVGADTRRDPNGRTENDTRPDTAFNVNPSVGGMTETVSRDGDTAIRVGAGAMVTTANSISSRNGTGLALSNNGQVEQVQIRNLADPSGISRGDYTYNNINVISTTVITPRN